MQEVTEIIKNLGKIIITPKGQQLLAGLQIGVLREPNGLKTYPNSIVLICWSTDGGKYYHAAIDCKIIEILVGKTVEVPDPEDPVKEGYNNGFVGTVKALKGNYATVADQDENCLDIEVSKLTVML